MERDGLRRRSDKVATAIRVFSLLGAGALVGYTAFVLAFSGRDRELPAQGETSAPEVHNALASTMQRRPENAMSPPRKLAVEHPSAAKTSEAAKRASKRMRSGDANDDSSWSSLPRSSWGFPERVETDVENVDANELYRHVELNPGDTHIDSAIRPELRRVLDRYRPKLVRLRRLHDTFLRKEMAILDEAGLTAKIPVHEVKELQVPDKLEEQVKASLHGPGTQFVIPAESMKPGTVVSIVGNDAHWAPTKQMPMAARTNNALELMRHELGLAIVAWFRSRGTLSAKAAGALRHELDQLKSFVYDGPGK